MSTNFHTKETLLKRLESFTKQKRRLPNTHNTKLQLIKLGLIKNQCFVCELTSWMGKEISLHLDHVDGNASNNNMNNLRLLCPNCHSQTDTYCGKNNKKTKNKPKYKNHCLKCSKKISSWSQYCLSCYHCIRENPTKISWPNNQELEKLLKERKTMEDLARQLQVSSNSIRKRCRKLGIRY